jgi:ADP-ribose pyrophosphatase
MKIKDRELVYDGYFKMEELKVESPAGETTRERLIKKGAAASIVYDTKKEKFIFVKQWRTGIEDFLIEIPAGTIDKPTDSPEETIIREIDEETGYKVDNIMLLSIEHPSPALLNETIHLYFAEVSEKISDGGGTDEHEFIDIIELSRSETYSKLMNGDLKDMKTNSSLSKLFLRQSYGTI